MPASLQFRARLARAEGVLRVLSIRRVEMTKKQLALLVAIILAWATIGDWRSERSVMAQSGRASSGAGSPQQPAPASATWEYKLLSGTTTRIASLESAINQLAEQGFVVDSFQITSHRISGNPGLVRRDSSGNVFPLGPYELSSETEMIVLLKRVRK